MNNPTYTHQLEDKMGYNKRGIVFFIALIFAITFLAGCAHFFYRSRFTPVVQLVSFLIFGCLYVAFMWKNFVLKKDSLPIALFLTAALFVSLGIFYFMKGSFRFVDILSLTSAFLLPSVVIEAWRSFTTGLTADRPVWSYSKDIPESPVFVYLENKPVRVKLLIESLEPVTISASMPLPLKLGLAVFYIIKKDIEENAGQWSRFFIRENGEPYKWLFYTDTGGIMKTYLHPDETVSDNKIRSHTLIIAKRLD